MHPRFEIGQIGFLGTLVLSDQSVIVGEVDPAAGFLFAACLLNQRIAPRLWALLEWVGRDITTRICGVPPRIECLHEKMARVLITTFLPLWEA
jgi:hypothetical protein